MLQQHSDLAVPAQQCRHHYPEREAIQFSSLSIPPFFPFELFQTSTHMEFRESSSSLLTPGGLKSSVSISQGSLQVHRAGKRQHLIFVPAWHSLHAAQPPSSAPRRAGIEIHSQIERLGTSKGCCQSGRLKMLSVLSCLRLFAKSTFSFQYRIVLFPGAAWSEYFSRSVSMSKSVTVLVQ